MSKLKKAKENEYVVTHDTFFDETFGMPSLGIAFLKKVLPRKLRKNLEIEKLTVAKIKFRDVLFRETRPDIVYIVPIRGTDECVRFHVIIEHKSSDDHSAIYQIWQYIAQLCVQDVKKRLTDPKTKLRKAWPKNFRLSPIIPIIIHHGVKRFTGATQLVKLFYPLPGAEKFLPHLQAILVDLSAIEDAKLPRDPNAPELHVVLLIMKEIFSKNRTTLINSFSAILKDLKPYSKNQKYYELIRKFWCYLVYNTEKLTETDYEELETEIQATIGDNNMPTLVQKWLAQGMEKGMEKGKAEGKAELILSILDDRFGEVPQSIQDAITHVSDFAVFRKLTILATKCKNLEEFAEDLKQSASKKIFD